MICDMQTDEMRGLKEMLCAPSNIYYGGFTPFGWGRQGIKPRHVERESRHREVTYNVDPETGVVVSYTIVEG